MRRRIRRLAVRGHAKMRKAHGKLGRMSEYSHLLYFGVLFLENGAKYTYAKIGGLCILFSILYLATEEKE